MRRFRDLSLVEWLMVIGVVAIASYVCTTGPYGFTVYRLTEDGQEEIVLPISKQGVQ